MVGHLKNVSPTFVQMPNSITNVEFTTVSPTIANTMLAAYQILFCLFVVTDDMVSHLNIFSKNLVRQFHLNDFYKSLSSHVQLWV